MDLNSSEMNDHNHILALDPARILVPKEVLKLYEKEKMSKKYGIIFKSY